MGPAFVLLGWLILLAILGVIWLGFVGLSILGWWKKWPWLKWGAAIPAVGMVLCGVLVAAILGYGLIRSMQPKYVFEDTFRKAPSGSVTQIQSQVFSFADTGSVFLRFQVEEPEMKALIPAGLALTTMAEMKDVSEFSLSGPDWWTVKLNPEWSYYLRNDRGLGKPGKKGFYSEVEYFVYDPQSRTAYYRFSGID